MIVYLGPSLCILEDLTEGEVELFIKEKKAWWERWFTSINQWDPNDIVKDRVVWLKIIGTPCHAWEDRIFTLLAGTRGSFIKSDEETKLKKRMDATRIYIKTKYMEQVDNLVEVSIEGVNYCIRLCEFCTLSMEKS